MRRSKVAEERERHDKRRRKRLCARERERKTRVWPGAEPRTISPERSSAKMAPSLVAFMGEREVRREMVKVV